MSAFTDTQEFCRKFGFPCPDEPGQLSPGMLIARLGLVKEEVIEMEGHVDQINLDPFNLEEYEGLLDAAVDIVYTVIVTCAHLGFNFDEAWRRVHAANMAKERATSTNNKRGSEWDVVKPDGWAAPVFDDLTTPTTLTVRDALCARPGSALSPTSQGETTMCSTAEHGKSSEE